MTKRPTMLSGTFVRNVNLPGRYGDGRGGLGLTLLVKPASRHGYCKSWGQSIRINGRKTTIGQGDIGSWPEYPTTSECGRYRRCASRIITRPVRNISCSAAKTLVSLMTLDSR